MSSTALAFNGSTDHGDSAATVDYSANTSLAFNVYFKPARVTGVQFIFIHGTTTTGGGLCLLSNGSSLFLYGFGQEIGIGSGLTLVTGTWYQVCGNVTGKNGVDPLIDWWVNGTLMAHNGVTNSGAQTGASANMLLAYTSSGGITDPYDGSIAQLAFWGDTTVGGGVSILSPTDVTNLYGGGTAGAPPSSIQAGRLLDYWPLTGAHSPGGSEPNSVGSRSAITLTGTSQDASGPPVVAASKILLPPSLFIPMGCF